MSIFKTAYDTTVGSGFVTNKIELTIKESIIKDYLQGISGGVSNNLDIKPIFLANSVISEGNIPYFSHPLLIEDIHQQKYLCIDVRQFVKNNRDNSINIGTFNIKNESEFNLAKSRLALNLIWLTQRPETIRDISHLPNAIFSSWISEGIANRFSLDPKDQMTLAIITSFYYQSLFTEFNTFIEEDRQKFVNSIIKATRAPAKMVFEVTDKIQKISNINDFCSACKSILENPRIENLNAGILITILGNSWFGMSAKELLAVSLEHPPSWIALVNSALTERTYKKSLLSRISERYAGNKGGNDFIKAFESLVDTVITKEDNSF
jgi:hypothetical protein